MQRSVCFLVAAVALGGVIPGGGRAVAQSPPNGGIPNHILAAWDRNPSSTPGPVGSQPGTGRTQFTPVGQNTTLVSTLYNVGHSRNRPLVNLNALEGTTIPSIYPGQIIDGDEYVAGRVWPYSVTRAPGTLVIDGVVVSGAPWRTVANPDRGSILQAQQAFLGTVRGQPANLNWIFREYDSLEEWAFNADLGLKTLVAQLKARLNINSSRHRSIVVASLVQPMYTLYWEQPQMPAGFFANPAHAAGQIGPRVPLFVNSATYGRAAVLVLASDYDKYTLKASVQAAYQGNVDVNAGGDFSVMSVLSQTSAAYIAWGGDASQAVQVIATSPQDMLRQLQQRLRDPQNAVVSPTNPGMLLSYSLARLNGQPAMTETNVLADAVERYYYTGAARVSVTAGEIDDSFEVWGDRNNYLWKQQGGWTSFDLNRFRRNSEAETVLELRHWNIGGRVSLNLNLYLEGQHIFHRQYGYNAPRGWISVYRLHIRWREGRVTVVPLLGG